MLERNLAELIEEVRGDEIEEKAPYISETVEKTLEMAGNPLQRAVSAESEPSLLSMMAKVASFVVMVVYHTLWLRHAPWTSLKMSSACTLQHLMIVKMLAMTDVIVVHLHSFV